MKSPFPSSRVSLPDRTRTTGTPRPHPWPKAQVSMDHGRVHAVEVADGIRDLTEVPRDPTRTGSDEPPLRRGRLGPSVVQKEW